MRFFSVVGISLVIATSAIARPYEEIMKEAQVAFASEDYATAGARLDEAQVERPYSLYLTRNRVLTRLLTNRADEAIAIAQEIADRGLVLDMPTYEAFDRMKALPAYAPVAARMSGNAKPNGSSRVIVEFTDNELLPEAISRRRNRLLIGSVRTGDIRDASADLTPVATIDGGVFDIEQTDSSIYAATNNQLAFERRNEKPLFAAIVELDRKTGVERRRIRIVAANALLGDIEIDKRGAVYASDSVTPRIFVAGKNDQEARILAIDTRWANPQGIALDRKPATLFLADYLTGLFSVDVETGAVAAIANPSNAHLGGIDGLYLHKGDLIGVQNGTNPQRIVRIKLDKSRTIAERLDVLAQNHDGWNEPTHGYIDGDEFIYIATSNWPAYDDDGNLREGATLAPLRIMSVTLKTSEK